VEGARAVPHPEHGPHQTLDDQHPKYARHGNHHTPHHTALPGRMGW
jgi:hypothetical protein